MNSGSAGTGRISPIVKAPIIDVTIHAHQLKGYFLLFHQALHKNIQKSSKISLRLFNFLLRKERAHQASYAFIKRLVKTYGESTILTIDTALHYFVHLKN